MKSSDELSVITDLVVSSNTALWKDQTVGDLYINNGSTLKLNGYTLNVKGNVYVSSGTLNISGGKLFVDGDLRIQEKNTASNGNTTYTPCYSYMLMTDEDDYVMVGGSFYDASRYSHSGKFTDGILSIKGDFVQISGSGSNFYASGNHRTILNGDSLQNVDLQSTDVHFATLELQNFSEDGVYFNKAINASEFIQNGCKVSFQDSGILGWALEDDYTYTGALNLVGDTLDLNGHTLTVNGDLTQSGGNIKINGGELIVNGNYKIQTTENGASSGTLEMKNADDKVTVTGDFVTRSTANHSSLLTAGTMTIGGNFNQYNSNNNYYNFTTSGTHKVILNGSKKQTVSFDYYYNYSYFNELEIANTSDDGVDFSTVTYVVKTLYDTDSTVTGSARLYLGSSAQLADNKWSYDLCIDHNRTLSDDWKIGGSLYITSNTFDVNGKKLTVGKDIGISGGTLYVNGGTVEAGKDLWIRSFYVSNDGTIIFNGSNYGYLKMTNEDDFVKVNGSFTTDAYYSHSGYLTNGILEVKGNFTQLRSNLCVYATSNHKVLLSGDEKQTISLINANARFATLEITNTSDDGVYVTSYFNADSIIDDNKKLSFANGKKTGWKLEKNETVEGFDLIYDTLDLNGHTLTVNGDLTQSGGNIKINGGELIVNGNYKIQTTENGASSGTLEMKNADDKVTVTGDFVTRSTANHSSLLTAGTMTIGGNFNQYNSNNNYYNFTTSGTHKVILNGSEKQTVSFDYYYNYSYFNELEIANTSDDGVDFSTVTYVVKTLYDTDSTVTGSARLYLGSSAQLADNKWSYDLCIDHNRTLSDDWKIGGSLYITSNTFDVNGKKLTVGKDIGISGGTLYVNGGTVEAGKDLWIRSFYVSNDGTIIFNGSNYGYLKMTNEDDFVKVNGSFTTDAYYSHSGYLTNGILEVKGNFTQLRSNENFKATNNHKVVLSGTRRQRITFESNSSKFNILEVNKPIDTGYIFSRTPLWESLIETEMDSQSPMAPANLSSDIQTATSIKINWTKSTDNNEVAGYDIYRNGIRVGNTSSTSFIDERLKSNTSYTYFVIAYDAMRNDSDWSNILEVKTLPDENAPTQPTFLKVKSQSDSAITLTWTASEDNSEVKGYDVYRNDILIGTVNGVSFTDNTVSSGLYEYYVKAFDDTNNYSIASESIVVDTEAPTIPVLEIDSYSNTQATLSWNSSDNVGVVKYDIYRDGQKIKTVSDNKYTDNSLDYDKNYEYYVIAYDLAGNTSKNSNAVTIFTGEDNEPPVITAICPSSSTYSGSIPLDIYAKDNACVSSITVEVSTDNESWKTIETIIADEKASTYINYDLGITDYNDGIIYVRAVATDLKENVSDEEKSPVVSYTIDNTAPTVVNNVTLSEIKGQLQISWDKPDDDDLDFFRIYRKESGSDTFELLKDKLETLNYFDTDIELAESYDYYVTAIDYTGNESVKSEIVSGGIVEDKDKPQVLSVLPTTGTKICNGRTMSISCKDNFRLSGIVVEFAPEGTELWEQMYSAKLSKNAEIVKFDLDMTNMSDGNYDVRVKVTDKAGLESDNYTATYDYKNCSISVPKLFATEKGWQIKLNWSATTDPSLLGYNIYRMSVDSNSFELLGRTTLNEYTDNNVVAGKTYFYYVEAVDEYNNVVSSDKVNAVPTSEDNIKPTAVAGENGYVLSNMAYNFDGSGSTDNHFIESYSWDFGDGTTSNNVSPSHTYTDPGTYDVVLTVTDSAGNSSTDQLSVTVYDEESYSYADVQLIDSSNNHAVANAMVFAELPDGDVTVSTNSSGIARLIAPFGTYKVSFYRDGYLPTSADITFAEGGIWNTVYIENGNLISGKIEVEKLDLQEIESLGIDTSAPENQYVYNYHVNIKTDDPKNPKKFSITVNGEGELINTDSYFDFNGTKFAILDMNTDHTQYVGLIPSAVPGEPPSIVLLDVSTTFTWLKEFFNVTLTVQNNASYEFYITDTDAEIKLPSGMSLASTNTNNSASRGMGTIYGGEEASVNWIVRGDTAGEYDIYADFSGILSPFNTEVGMKFKTDKPVKVYGGDALKLVIEQEYYDDKYNCWQVDFKLTNVSDITIYNPSVNYSGYSEFLNVNDMTIVYPNGIIEIIPWENGNADKKNIQRFLPALLKDGESETINLKPGESIVGHYSASKKTL